MGIWYCTREEVKQALDFKQVAWNNPQVDRAIDDGARAVENLTNRVFYPTLATRYFDFPNWQYTYPWKLYLDANELAGAATAILSGATVIPVADVNFEPIDQGPPYTRLEIQRSKADYLGHSSTPQRDVAVTGPFGYWLKTEPRGSLAAQISSTSATTITISNSSSPGSGIGVGDILLIDSEVLVVTERTMITTGQTQQGSGVGTAVKSDVTLAVTDGTQYTVGEILLLDSERMKIVDIASNNLTVLRAWDGTTLATHSGATVFAPRQCTVTRGDLGTTAATHSNAAPISRYAIPGTVRSLNIAEAINTVEQETSGYARTTGSGASARPTPGVGLDDIRNTCYGDVGRKNRQRAV